MYHVVKLELKNSRFWWTAIFLFSWRRQQQDHNKLFQIFFEPKTHHSYILALNTTEQNKTSSGSSAGFVISIYVSQIYKQQAIKKIERISVFEWIQAAICGLVDPVQIRSIITEY